MNHILMPLSNPATNWMAINILSGKGYKQNLVRSVSLSSGRSHGHPLNFFQKRVDNSKAIWQV